MTKEWVDIWDTPREEDDMSLREKEIIGIYNDLSKEIYYGSNFQQALIDSTQAEIDAFKTVISFAQKRRGVKK